MVTKAEIRAEALRLQSLFEDAGALVVEADILQPADTLLDLYGEDIRARAFVTNDPLRGERMLRPDFTVPVVQMHMSNGAEPARYTYSGEVFRKQDDDPDRATEYMQVGFELFDGSDPAAADAEVFALMARAVEGLNLRAATGDMGLLMAAVSGLRTTERRKAALMRHIWRPNRFRALLDRFAGRREVPSARAALIAQTDPEALIRAAAPQIGLRSGAEVLERVSALQADALEPPISGGEVALVDSLLEVRGASPAALSQLHDLAVDMPAIEGAVARLAARLDALSARGIDVDTLEFEARYGRTSLEYYDGFVFGFYAGERGDLPPVSTGGRYDALTRVLGRGRSIPAVGGVIRPHLAVTLRKGAS